MWRDISIAQHFQLQAGLNVSLEAVLLEESAYLPASSFIHLRYYIFRKSFYSWPKRKRSLCSYLMFAISKSYYFCLESNFDSGHFLIHFFACPAFTHYLLPTPSTLIHNLLNL